MTENITCRFSHDYTAGFCENNEADEFISVVMRLFGSIRCLAMVKKSYLRVTYMTESPVLSCPVLVTFMLHAQRYFQQEAVSDIDQTHASILYTLRESSTCLTCPRCWYDTVIWPDLTWPDLASDTVRYSTRFQMRLSLFNLILRCLILAIIMRRRWCRWRIRRSGAARICM